MNRILGLIPVALLSLAACSGSSSSDGPVTGKDIADATAKSAPCSKVWVEGKVLPKNFENCVGEDGSLVLGAFYDCDDGREFTASDDGKLFAFLGEKIQAGDDDAYSAAFGECKPT